MGNGIANRLPALRAKSEKLTAYLESQVLARLPNVLEIVTPAEPAALSRLMQAVGWAKVKKMPPKLRLGELDLFVGRLEPGYASPDLETEALFDDPMAAVVHPAHPLARKRKMQWVWRGDYNPATQGEYDKTMDQLSRDAA